MVTGGKRWKTEEEEVEEKEEEEARNGRREWMSRGARMDEEMDNKDERAKVAKNNHEGGGWREWGGTEEKALIWARCFFQSKSGLSLSEHLGRRSKGLQYQKSGKFCFWMFLGL